MPVKENFNLDYKPEVYRCMLQCHESSNWHWGHFFSNLGEGDCCLFKGGAFFIFPKLLPEMVKFFVIAELRRPKRPPSGAPYSSCERKGFYFV